MSDTDLRKALCDMAVAAVASLIAGIDVQVDANSNFTPPQAKPWARIIIKDGNQTIAAFGASAPLWRGPVALYVDVFTPLNSGDGLAVDACEALRLAIRQFTRSGLRFLRIEPGAEGPVEGQYRKQLIGIYERTERG